MINITQARKRFSAANIIYWLTTVFIAYELALGALWDFNILNKMFEETMMHQLGYPLYFAYIMGAWKIPGAIVMLVNGLPRLKEWVYAGAIFIYTGGMASHLFTHDLKAAAVPFVCCVLTFTSYLLRPPSRKL